MPVVFEKEIDAVTRLAVWEIRETEAFFLEHVPVHRTITHPHKRLQHLAGRFLLKYLFPAFPVELIQVADTRKPYLPGEAYHFSISHCGQYAAVIVSTRERVGIDIEIPSEKVERISHKFLHPEELLRVRDNGSEDRLRLLTLLWSCKEAVFKWWSYGQVDFSEQIRLESFPSTDAGSLLATFYSDKKHPLELTYQMFDDITLAWVATVDL
ncbi:MAG TPA: 4'-phosphopantetheinyl transferase superfamily protein [Flavisolibacter sp.]